MGQIPLYIEIYRSTADQRKKHMLKRTVGYNWQRCRWQYRSIFSRLAVDSLLLACCNCNLPPNPKSAKSRGSPKIRTFSSSRLSKANNLVANRKRICNFLLIIISHFGRISYVLQFCLRDIDAFSSKIALFPQPTLVRRTLAKERPAIST